MVYIICVSEMNLKMEMTYDGVLVMPNNYVVVNEEEMTYVDGGGTLTVTIKASTIKNVIGLLGGAVSGYAIQLGLDALAAHLVIPIEIGTAGMATVAVAMFLVLWNGAAAAISAAIVGGLVGMGASKLYRGGNITKSFSGRFLPTMNLRV